MGRVQVVVFVRVRVFGEAAGEWEVYRVWVVDCAGGALGDECFWGCLGVALFLT